MGYNLLVVDRGVLSPILENNDVTEFQDISMGIVYSVEEALQELEERNYNAIVCYSELGNSLQGIDLLQWLRNSGSRIPFFLIANEISKELAIRATNLNANLFLRKDIEEYKDVFNELMVYIRSSMKQKSDVDIAAEETLNFQGLFETSIDGLVASDLEGRIILYNESFANLLGIATDEYQGVSFSEFVPPEYLTAVRQIGHQVQKIGYSDYVELNLLASDGKHIPVIISAWRRDNADGIPIGAWVWIHDQSETKEFEQKLVRSETKFRTMFDDSPIAIAIADMKGRVVEMNPECVRMFGLHDPTSLIGYDMFADRDFSPDVRDALLNGEKIWFFEEYSFDKVREDNTYSTSRTGVITLKIFCGPLHYTSNAKIDGYIFQILEISDVTDEPKKEL